MECHVPRANLRAFSNALVTLGKIGKEVFFETTDNEVGVCSRASVRVCACARVRVWRGLRASGMRMPRPPRARLTGGTTAAFRSPQLVLRTLNESRSAFASFTFTRRESPAAAAPRPRAAVACAAVPPLGSCRMVATPDFFEYFRPAPEDRPVRCKFFVKVCHGRCR